MYKKKEDTYKHGEALAKQTCRSVKQVGMKAVGSVRGKCLDNVHLDLHKQDNEFTGRSYVYTCIRVHIAAHWRT